MTVTIDSCPACAGNLEIREYYCAHCDVTVRGHFTSVGTAQFSNLDSEQLAFLKLFVTSRGNMSDIERTLGVSYPTVRAKLDDLIASIEDVDVTESAPLPGPQSRSELFADVSSGKLDVDAAMQLLKNLPKNND